ncbi:hypothetical protein GCM10011332_19670 [Terasakiella brassicae]|uniref:Uncharacterized protein n=1 Tax=Terasakiella brassicae TaxID=1634917 RepID=A0A917C2I1_9PROT|nr:hypothetical protein [Terasakiella brassicae]GGF65643.1 hypothetical protein GCM10011332_19670 [Terasakiella brassicae]
MEKLPCKNTFDMTVHIVVSAVKEKLATGEITPDDLDEIEQALTVENSQVEAFCHSVHERCMSKSKLDLLVPPRTNAYGRIMVQPLERLFDKRHRRFSERQLANYFHMLSSIIGREVYEKNHDQMSELMRSEIRDHGSNFSWDSFYNHPEVVRCRLETLGAIAQAFDHFDQRMNWFINVMEGSAHNPEDGAGTLQFTEQQAKAFLSALFTECMDMTEGERERLQQYVGERRRKNIAFLIARLTQM